VRKFLKAALRSFGLVSEGIADAPPDTQGECQGNAPA
jgi:hypothetical protein